MEHSYVWEIVKFITSVIIIPFGVWIVRTVNKLKDDISGVEKAMLIHNEEIAKTYTPKEDLTTVINQIDSKMTSMQNAVTQRIDVMQTNIATMIASAISSKRKD